MSERADLLPKPVTMLDVAFGNIDQLPPMSEIPEEFKSGRSQWCDLFSRWFFMGLKETPKVKDGIDKAAAIGVIRSCMGSYAPQHEHKEAGCAYLMSLWLDESALKIERAKDRQ